MDFGSQQNLLEIKHMVPACSLIAVLVLCVLMLVDSGVVSWQPLIFVGLQLGRDFFFRVTAGARQQLCGASHKYIIVLLISGGSSNM